MDPAYIRLECLKLVVGESKGASVNRIIARAAYLERLVIGGFGGAEKDGATTGAPEGAPASPSFSRVVEALQDAAAVSAEQASQLPRPDLADQISRPDQTSEQDRRSQ